MKLRSYLINKIARDFAFSAAKAGAFYRAGRTAKAVLFYGSASRKGPFGITEIMPLYAVDL
ncbi:MAG TPA: hypothetical protein VF493_16890 [Terriglobales bacterium]